MSIYFERDKHAIDFIVNMLSVYGFHIRKCRITKVSPNFIGFLCKFEKYIITLTLFDTKKKVTKPSNCTVSFSKRNNILFSFFSFSYLSKFSLFFSKLVLYIIYSSSHSYFFCTIRVLHSALVVYLYVFQ